MGSQTELVRMKILSLFCLLFGLAQCGRPNPACWEQCDKSDFVVVVKCTDVLDDSCICDTKDQENVGCETYFGPTKAPQDWTQCHQLVMDLDGPLDGFDDIEIGFFRWENKDDTEGMTHCYLLEKCSEVASECAPFVGSPCVAGPSSECEPTSGKTCLPPKWNKEGLHWTCVLNNEPISPYDDTIGPLPEGTTCLTGSVTNEACSTWNWKEGEHGDLKIAQVECGDSGWKIQDGTFGLETKDAPPVPILPDVDANDDATCKCDKLEFAEGTFPNPSINLVCDTIINTTEDEAGIVFPNGCALLCDGHFMMYIECYKGKWMNTAGYPFKEVGPADIKC